MKKCLMTILFFYSLILSAKGSLTIEELTIQADQICSGQIKKISRKYQSLSENCSYYKIYGEVDVSNWTCIQTKGKPFSTKISYETEIKNDEWSVFNNGHDPIPEFAQKGTVYIKNGIIVHPNGWQEGEMKFQDKIVIPDGWELAGKAKMFINP
jgi:hypothetical protein